MTSLNSPPTLAGRLTRRLTAILVLVFVAQGVTLALAIRKVAEHQMLNHLQHDGDGLLSALSFDAAGRPALDTAALEEVYRQASSGHYYVVHIDGRLRFASPSRTDDAPGSTPLGPGKRQSYHAAGPDGQSVLALTRGFGRDGHNISITIAEDLTELDGEVREFTLVSLAGLLPLMAAAVLMQNFGIRRALRPLAGIHGELRQIERGELARIEGEVPGEIQPLVDEINRLLALVQRRLQQSRRALGNLAHALKTPLAMLFRIADDAALPPALSGELRGQTGAIHARIERELKRARLAGSGASGAGINLHAELQVLARLLHSVHHDKSLDLVVDAPDRYVAYDREDILELLGNLADNACKWARRIVRIEAAEAAADEPAGLRLTVADDGPGCTADEARQLVRRGLRLDESRSGHGLGLAIVQDIVNSYDGTLDIDRDPQLGGLRVRVSLPRYRAGARPGQ